VALSIAEVLNATLTQHEAKQLDQTPTTNLDAYDLYLRGKFLMEKRNKPDILMARELFEQAVVNDVQFANAYSGLAVTYLLASFRGYEDPVRMLWQAKKNIDQALALDPSSGESQASLGYWYHQKFDWHAAEITYKRAIELNPNQSNVYLWLAILFEGKGEIEEALKIYDKGCTINAGWDFLVANKIRCLFNANKKDEAIKLQKQLIEKNEAEPVIQKQYYADLARLYWSSGNETEAIEAATEGGNNELAGFFRDGNASLLEKQVDEKYEELRKNSEYISQLWMGLDYAKAGVKEKALDCFNNAIALKDVAITLLLVGHFDFINIKYLSLALIKRKVKMLVNF
jgi:tetratricopeptide (TPR) repeat protein